MTSDQGDRGLTHPTIGMDGEPAGGPPRMRGWSIRTLLLELSCWHRPLMWLAAVMAAWAAMSGSAQTRRKLDGYRQVNRTNATTGPLRSAMDACCRRP